MRNLRRRIVVMLCTTIAATGIALAVPGIANAHHPVLEGATARACGDSPWTATVTVRSDADYGKDWSVNGDAFVDDQVPYTVSGELPATQASVTFTANAQWRNKSGQGGFASASRSITLDRPAAYDCPPETTEPPVTTAPPTTEPPTTEPPVTDPPTTEPPTTEPPVTTLPTTNPVPVCQRVPIPAGAICGPADPIPSGPSEPEICILYTGPPYAPGTGITSRTLQPCGQATPPVVELPKTGLTENIIFASATVLIIGVLFMLARRVGKRPIIW